MIDLERVNSAVFYTIKSATRILHTPKVQCTFRAQCTGPAVDALTDKGSLGVDAQAIVPARVYSVLEALVSVCNTITSIKQEGPEGPGTLT